MTDSAINYNFPLSIRLMSTN